MSYLSTSQEPMFPYSFPFPADPGSISVHTNAHHGWTGLVDELWFPNPQMSNSNSDDSEETRHGKMIDERRQRRMISNRESARRSRMRKQRHLDELWAQVIRLRNENHGLTDRLTHLSESHDQAMLENARLKEETADLRQMVSSMQLASQFNALTDLEDIPCSSTHLSSDEPSHQSVSN